MFLKHVWWWFLLFFLVCIIWDIPGRDVSGKPAFCSHSLHWDYSTGLFVFLLIRVSLCLSLSPAGVNDCCCLPEQDNLLSQLEPPADSCLAFSWWKTAISAEWKSVEQRPYQHEELLLQQQERARTLLFPGVKQFFLFNCHAQQREGGFQSLSPREEILKRGGSFEEGFVVVLRVLDAAAGCWRHGVERGERFSLPWSRGFCRARSVRGSSRASAAGNLGRLCTKWISNFVSVFVEDR